MSAREERQPVEPVALTEEQLDALAAAGNRALNDHYHDDLCLCREWPESCATRGYFPGMWDTGAFDIGLGAVLGLWESMRADTAAAELARLRARVAELETERHTTNEVLSDAAETLRADRDRIAELCRQVEAERPEAAQTHRCGIPLTRRLECGHCPHEVCEDCDRCPHTCRCGTPAEDVSPQVQKLRDILAGQREDTYRSPLHHDYAVPRDFPTTTETSGSAL